MPAVLICSEERLDETLDETVLWRDDVERTKCARAEQALSVAREQSPDLVLVHRDLAGAVELIRGLRRSPETRKLSMVVLAPEDFNPLDVELLEVGANAILRLPPNAEWNDRLTRLMSVPVRKSVRFSVEFELLAQSGGAVELIQASALNLSVSGILIETARPFRVGEDLDFHFRLPGHEETIHGCGRVVRVGGPRRYGIEFYGLEGSGTAQIQSYLDGMGGA
jgi:CheY-like chemotaxis protein